MKNKYIFYTGICALLLGISLSSSTNRRFYKSTDLPPRQPTSQEEVKPEKVEEKPIQYRPIDISCVIFDDPSSGQQRIVLMKIEDSWPEIQSTVTNRDFTNIIFGETELRPFIFGADNHVEVLFRRALSDSSLTLETQTVFSYNRDDDCLPAQGIYEKSYMTFGEHSLETKEIFVKIGDITKTNFTQTIMYDELGNLSEMDDIFKVYTSSLNLLRKDLDINEYHPIEYYIELERQMNESFEISFLPVDTEEN